MFRLILVATFLLASCTSTHELKVVSFDIEKPNLNFEKPTIANDIKLVENGCPSGLTCLESNEFLKIIENLNKINGLLRNLKTESRYYKNIK